MKISTLLTRDKFRELALKRDNNSCVICLSTDKLSVHHIIERKLFDDGGYYLDNAATLCEKCHLLAEDTSLSADFIRKKCSIENVLLPKILSKDKTYDKWGNEIIGDYRLPGPLFFEPGTKKILNNILHLFIKQSPKYPRTMHFSFSPGKGIDDKVLEDDSIFLNKEVVVTYKMDGSNVCLEKDLCFSRSHSGPPKHPSFDMFKAFHSNIKNLIPEDIQIFGEWLYAKHTISYSNLPNYLMIFGVRDLSKGVWYSWEEVKLWAEEIGTVTVPEFFLGSFGNISEIENIFKDLMNSDFSYGEKEGMVLRLVGEFSDLNFSNSVAKCVKKNFVQTSTHWKHEELIKNTLTS